jgi:hypothetical protein
VRLEDALSNRVYAYRFSGIYPLYLTKIEKKGRTKAELDETLCWLTGLDQTGLDVKIAGDSDLETFFTQAPALNPARSKVTGVVCGVRIEEIAEPTMREIRIMDKVVDELAKGKAMEKILRK